MRNCNIKLRFLWHVSLFVPISLLIAIKIAICNFEVLSVFADETVAIYN